MLDTHTQLSYMQLVHVMVCSYMMPRAYEPLKEHETQSGMFNLQYWQESASLISAKHGKNSEFQF